MAPDPMKTTKSQRGRNACDIPLPEEELLRLWDEAWAVARALCSRTLGRLRGGGGGFYGADDLQQDLFLEFWPLAESWWAQGEHCEEELWARWRSRLWGAAIVVLRRKPQRLWKGCEWAVAPDALALDGEGETSGDDGTRRSAPNHAALRALVQPEDAQSTGEQLERLAALESALWSLRPTQRQLLYMAVLAELPGDQIGRCLALNRDAVYQRLRTARKALGRRLDRPR